MSKQSPGSINRVTVVVHNFGFGVSIQAFRDLESAESWMFINMEAMLRRHAEILKEFTEDETKLRAEISSAISERSAAKACQLWAEIMGETFEFRELQVQ